MSLLGEVIPRQHAAKEELRALGQGLERWYRRESSQEGVAHYIDTYALADLLAGELPQPFALRFSTKSNPRDPQGCERPETTLQQLREAAPRAAASRTLFFKVWAETVCSRVQVVASLRQEIRPEWVEDVLIDGRSWYNLKPGEASFDDA